MSVDFFIRAPPERVRSALSTIPLDHSEISFDGHILAILGKPVAVVEDTPQGVMFSGRGRAAGWVVAVAAEVAHLAQGGLYDPQEDRVINQRANLDSVIASFRAALSPDGEA